jgi:hypothetical protein
MDEIGAFSPDATTGFIAVQGKSYSQCSRFTVLTSDSNTPEEIWRSQG